MKKELNIRCFLFLLTPLREGRLQSTAAVKILRIFLLTPLREGRRCSRRARTAAGTFLLTPLREGRH